MRNIPNHEGNSKKVREKTRVNIKCPNGGRSWKRKHKDHIIPQLLSSVDWFIGFFTTFTTPKKKKKIMVFVKEIIMPISWLTIVTQPPLSLSLSLSHFHVFSHFPIPKYGNGKIWLGVGITFGPSNRCRQFSSGKNSVVLFQPLEGT